MLRLSGMRLYPFVYQGWELHIPDVQNEQDLPLETWVCLVQLDPIFTHVSR